MLVDLKSGNAHCLIRLNSFACTHLVPLQSSSYPQPLAIDQFGELEPVTPYFVLTVRLYYLLSFSMPASSLILAGVSMICRVH